MGYQTLVFGPPLPRSSSALILCGTIAACGAPTGPSETLILPTGPPADAPRNEIVFVAHRESGPLAGREIWAARADGSSERQITDDAVVNDVTSFRLAPDSTGIIFEGTTRDGLTAIDVWIVNIDGSNPINVTNAADQWPGDEGRPTFSDPSWAPDRSAIAVAYLREGASSIQLLHPDGSLLDAIGDNPGSFRDVHPRWSPSGTAVAFLSNRLGSTSADDWRLFVADIPAGETRLISDDLTWVSGGTWSPDGNTLLYSGRSSTGERSIYLTMPGDPTPAPKVVIRGQTDEFLDATFPVWHPDGGSVAFIGVTNATRNEIFVVNTDGSGLRRVTFLNATGTRNPVFSPDGMHIAFTSDVDGFIGIYVVRLSDLRVWMATARGSGFQPEWLPIR